MSVNKPGASKNDDCYFYYYASGCSKGGMCPFRHEPGALAQETVCTFWKQGKCTKTNCIFRHMDLDKKRNVIPCYWEKTTTGCQKVIHIIDPRNMWMLNNLEICKSIADSS